MLRISLALLILVLAAPRVPAQSRSTRNRAFTPQMAEHLLNRAGFGGTPAEIYELVKLGRERAVRRMIDGPSGYDPVGELPIFEVELTRRPGREEFRGLTREERQAKSREYRRQDRRQFQKFRAWWIDRMVRTKYPLVEKMTLFWHGHFTSSYRDVRNSFHMINQNQLFREHAIGDFRDLLHAVAKDPAMLEYLDNNRNRKGRPNENFAREVMELFTLGVGHYTEKDIKEAARAFTGWTFRGNEFVMQRRQHDEGVKRVLGRRGKLTGEQVLDILLGERVAKRWIAGKLIAWFVGPNAPKDMVARYARLLERQRWKIRPVLVALLNDDDFYREEVMCSRITGPVEFVVSLSRRLAVEPPGEYLVQTAALLGQSLLEPPNVKGWEGGTAWITTSTMLNRGNLASYLVTGVNPSRMRRDYLGDSGMKRLTAQQRRGLARMIPRVPGRGGTWDPDFRVKTVLAHARAETPEAIVEELAARYLAVPITDEARASLVAFCREAGTRTGDTFQVPTEYQLKRLMRILLSLPEAQLH